MKKNDKTLDGEHEAPTKERLLRAGREEFCQKGYQQASLRSICAACGVTTGAFYFFFPSKDALLCAIVDPVIEKWTALAHELGDQEVLDPSTGRDNDRRFMEFELAHRQELLILMEKSAGSSREHFNRMVLDTMTHYFNKTFFHMIGRTPNPDVIKLLVSLRFQGNMSVLKGAYDMEQAFFLNDVLACYADGGFENLIKNLKDVL